MLMPSLFGENLLDDFFDVPVVSRMRGFGSSTNNIMHTDVKETDYGYEIDMNLPGVKKEDVQAQLKDGYLNITATMKRDEQQEEGSKYIRRERYVGSCKNRARIHQDGRRDNRKSQT